jgi:phosphoribosylamine--glycine ligase
MKILVLGSGGREHALAWKLNESPIVSRITCAPGNPGMEKFATLVPLTLGDCDAVADYAAREGFDLTVVGPEQPLADGIVDLFRQRGLAVFGPTRRAAELEWSKKFAKDFMRRHGIPTADYACFESGEVAKARAYLEQCSLPIVLKADGLAAGKGVIICQTRTEALQALHDMVDARVFGAAGSTVVVEEFMTGQEASVFAISDGAQFVTLAPAQDHKRVFDGDRGKNTGGMGAYAPTPFVTPEISGLVEERIIRPTLQGMAAEGRSYTGCLYVGLMLTEAGPKVVEYNCRFGDPETQVVVPLYDGDFAQLLQKSASGDLSGIVPSAHAGHAVCVVLASQGYPGAYTTGLPIAGLEKAESIPGVAVFHAGTTTENGEIVTSGGRVLGVTARVSGSLQEAVDRAYEAVNRVSFAGAHFRRDIARKALLASGPKR